MRIRKALQPGDYNPKAPSPVKVTYFEKQAERKVYPGEARNKAKVWAGALPYQSLVIVRGRIELLAPGRGLLRTRSAEIQVWFFEMVTPPHLKNNDSIAVIGRLWTSNLGANYSMQSCILLKKGYRMSLSHMMRKYSVAPSTFMDLPQRYALALKDKKPKV